MRKRLFNPGDLLQTKGLNSLIADNPERYNEVRNAYFRYIAGDWGNTCKADQELNNAAVTTGEDRIVAKYNLSFASIFIITEHDRSYTTLMLCEEY